LQDIEIKIIVVEFTILPKFNLYFYFFIMRDLFLGTVFTKINKKHLCHTCGGDIMPDKTKKIFTRHDV